MERRDRPVTDHDLRVLTKAEDLLKDESVWNRQDDRECEDDESTGKRSLFCALQKACIEVLGKYDHGPVALQEVRFAIQDVTGGRKFEHRLKDFNNLPETQLVDIRKVLQMQSTQTLRNNDAVALPDNHDSWRDVPWQFKRHHER